MSGKEALTTGMNWPIKKAELLLLNLEAKIGVTFVEASPCHLRHHRT